MGEVGREGWGEGECVKRWGERGVKAGVNGCERCSWVFSRVKVVSGGCVGLLSLQLKTNVEAGVVEVYVVGAQGGSEGVCRLWGARWGCKVGGEGVGENAWCDGGLVGGGL